MIIKPQFKLKEYENGLYLVSTPLGNLKDITLRAIEVLQKSHYILCEDTRVSKNLLDKYQIKSKLISNHKFNEKKNVVKIIEYLKSGKIISLISDAGTPGISDPGSILVNECIYNQIKIFPIPGPSAIAAAVSISGFSDKFLFCDTNILTTIAWSKTHFNGYCNEWIVDQSKKLSYDYYLILNVDTEWVQDDLRDRPNEREKMFEAHKLELDLLGVSYDIIIGSDYKKRFEDSIDFISKKFLI